MTEKTMPDNIPARQGTEKLFYKDSHMREFDARVIYCIKLTDKKEYPKAENIYAIELDRTAFFPEGGGQYADTGILGGVKILDVQEKDGRIFHIAKEPLGEGVSVRGGIDWDARFMKMQQHTGEHIVSGIVHSEFGYTNVGFHLGSEDCTMDFDGELSPEDLVNIEQKANRAVWENIKVLTLYPNKDELKRMDYRSKIEIDGQVRIIEIPGYDRCACCAPHVSYTGEIGLIKLTGAQRYKGGMRVTMLCGVRALSDYADKQNQIKKISGMLCAKEDEAADGVSHLKEELIKMKQELSRKEEKLVSVKAELVPSDEENVCLFTDDLEPESMRFLMNRILDGGHRICALFRSMEGEKKGIYRYVVGSRSEDVRELAAKMNAAFCGRGGGKAEMVQGTLQGTDREIKDWFFKEAGEI